MDRETEHVRLSAARVPERGIIVSGKDTPERGGASCVGSWLTILRWKLPSLDE